MDQCARLGLGLYPNKICLQINQKDTISLDVDAVIRAQDPSTIGTSDSSLEPADERSAAGKGSAKKTRIRSIGMKLLGVLLLGCLTAVGAHRSDVSTVFSIFAQGLIVFGKRYHHAIRERMTGHAVHQDERCLPRDEPGLDEFNVMVDDRVGKEHVHVENPYFSTVEWRPTPTNQSVALLTKNL